MAEEGEDTGESQDPTPGVRRRDLLHPKESFEIKAACIRVHEELGAGFLEKVYENALALELGKRGYRVVQQAKMDVYYDGQIVGEYFADLLVNDLFVLEIKAADRDHPIHEAQLIHYLQASGKPLGFLVNFGKEFFTFKRVVFTGE